jgi:hypothetical protein
VPSRGKENQKMKKKSQFFLFLKSYLLSKMLLSAEGSYTGTRYHIYECVSQFVVKSNQVVGLRDRARGDHPDPDLSSPHPYARAGSTPASEVWLRKAVGRASAKRPATVTGMLDNLTTIFLITIPGI